MRVCAALLLIFVFIWIVLGLPVPEPLPPLLGPVLVIVSLLLVGVVAYRHQVDILVGMGKPKVALKLLSDHIENHPQDAVAYVKRARLYYRDGKLRRAVNDYNQALDLGAYKLKSVIYTELGQIYFAAAKYKKALEALEMAYANKSHFHPTLAWLAIAHYAQRNFDEARIWWEHAKKQYPRYQKLDGTNWVQSQPGWLSPAMTEAQKITALLNARE